MHRLRLLPALLLLAAVPAAKGDTIVETAQKAGDFKTLVAAVKAAGLAETLSGEGPFTVFAPTDAAFAKLPKGTVETLLKPENKDKLTAILTYHVAPAAVPAAEVVKLKFAPTVNGQPVPVTVRGDTVTLGGAKVVTTDIKTDNGIIHVIDDVLLPETKTIPEVAEAAGSFKTLLAAAKAAGLVEALSGKGPLTVFAPTDEAFDKLPKGTIETLLKPENKGKLADILKYHVVAGRVYSPDALKAGKAKTLQGGEVAISTRDGAAFVGPAKLVKTDVPASNGVIHVIDSVLIPGPGGEDTAMTPAEAKRVLAAAVADGAARFNPGDHVGCAAVYMAAGERITAASHTLPAGAVRQMRTTLSNASHSTCPTTRSWTMRAGIDRTYAMLDSH